jgi:hypothetical protein
MPGPTVRDVHIDRALTGMSIGYRNQNYIAEQVFPRIPVQKKSDLYFVFPREAWFLDQVQVRAPGARAANADYALTTASYVALTYAISKVIPDEVRANADAPLQPDVEATEFTMDSLMRAQERRVAAIVTASAKWGSSACPTVAWSTDTSDPLGDIETGVNAVIQSTGFMPNTAVMSWSVWRKLRNHPDLLDRVKYTRPGGKPAVTDLQDWFGFDKVLIGTALYDNIVEGQVSTSTMTFVWGKEFWIGYVPANAAMMTPSAGYLLEWNARQIRRFRREEEYCDVIEASHSTAEVVTASPAGYLIMSAVA